MQCKRVYAASAATASFPRVTKFTFKPSFTRAHPLESDLLSAIRHLSIFNIIHITLNTFFEATDLHKAVFFYLFYTASPRSTLATHYTKDPLLKLDQTKCNAAVCIKNLLATPPNIVHDPSGQCSLRKMYSTLCKSLF